LSRSYDLAIENIAQLVTCDPSLFDAPDPGGREIGVIENAAIALSGDKVGWVGRQSDFAASGTSASSILSGEGLVVLPGFVDAHTHALFVGTREREYEMRIKGRSYMDIARSGGGIKSTVRAVREASLEELVAAGLANAASMLRCGTTTLEVKSGYGLNLESELKMLRAIALVGRISPVDVVPTFLGAHEIPDEFDGRREAYVSLVCDEMVPAVGEAGLAEFCDVFCERGVFSAHDSTRILESAKACGMKPMIHADEFSDSGAAQVAADVGAVSAGHLLRAAGAGLEAMQRAGTTAVLLPGVGLGLASGEFADARLMFDMGLDVALATDFNPGSSMVHSLPLVSSLACSLMRLAPAEAIFAMTWGGARALRRETAVGSLSPGKRADLVLFDVPDFRYIPYHLGGATPTMVIIGGEVAYRRDLEEADA
jgi:imidazolonepropionase